MKLFYQKSATFVYAAGRNLRCTALHKYSGKLDTATMSATLYTNDAVSTNDMSIHQPPLPLSLVRVDLQEESGD